MTNIAPPWGMGWTLNLRVKKFHSFRQGLISKIHFQYMTNLIPPWGKNPEPRGHEFRSFD